MDAEKAISFSWLAILHETQGIWKTARCFSAPADESDWNNLLHMPQNIEGNSWSKSIRVFSKLITGFEVDVRTIQEAQASLWKLLTFTNLLQLNDRETLSKLDPICLRSTQEISEITPCGDIFFATDIQRIFCQSRRSHKWNNLFLCWASSNNRYDLSLTPEPCLLTFPTSSNSPF